MYTKNLNTTRTKALFKKSYVPIQVSIGSLYDIFEIRSTKYVVNSNAEYLELRLTYVVFNIKLE